MERLDDGDARPPNRIVGGRRDEGKCVVEMSHINCVRVCERFQAPEAASAPDRIPCGPNRSWADTFIVIFVAQDRMTVLFQQGGFTRENAIFPAGLPVVVVDAKNGRRLHNLVLPLSGPPS